MTLDPMTKEDKRIESAANAHINFFKENCEGRVALTKTAKIGMVRFFLSDVLNCPFDDFEGTRQYDRKLTLARQLWHYISSTFLGIQPTELANYIDHTHRGMDYNCKVVESMREDVKVDAFIRNIESQLRFLVADID